MDEVPPSLLVDFDAQGMLQNSLNDPLLALDQNKPAPLSSLQQEVLNFMLLLSEEHHLPQTSVGAVNEGLTKILKIYNGEIKVSPSMFIS